MSVKIVICAICVLFMPLTPYAVLSDTDLNGLSEQQNSIKINKCCETNELMVDGKCRLAEKYNRSIWQPKFKTDAGQKADIKYFRLITGLPDCVTTQERAIFFFNNTEDELRLLTDGTLKHLIHHEHSPDNILEDPYSNMYGLHEPIPIVDTKEPASFVYVQGKYCLDTILLTKSNLTAEYATICVPEVKINWKDTDFLMKKVLSPLFHSINMILLLSVAIIYFVLPTLRDLAGNIITSITVCLIFAQAANLVRIFTELSNHVSFMIADIFLYVSLLGAFFWLNSYGFYIWKTFKSRNVFLRVTDVRKYCYYSSVVWSTVVMMTAMAICAHFLLDTSNNPYRKTKKQFSSSILVDDYEQETIGWLGIAIFFTPIAFTIIFNIFFYITTMKVIKRINIYGRIHYKLKGCFDLFLQLFLILTIWWLFLLLSWLNFDGLIYAYIVINLMKGVLIFYVCILRQSHVIFLLRKSCCYAEPVPTGEWGDEMTHMNGHYSY